MEIYENRRAFRIWKDFELNILYSGLADTGPEWQAEHVRSPFSRLYFILEGEGLARIGEKTLRLRAGSIYLIPAEMDFSYSCEAHMEQLFFHVNVNGQNGMDYFRDCRRLLEREGNPERIGLIRRLYRSEGAADAFRLKGMIWEELAAFAQEGELPEPSEQNYSELVSRFFFLARNPVSAASQIRGLAEALHVSESTLSKRFRRETGIAPGAYLNRLVLDRACRLLLSGEMSIAEVAERLGFSDQFYFTKYFRRQMSMTPSAYRKLMRRG